MNSDEDAPQPASRIEQSRQARDHGRALYRDESGEPVIRDSIAAFVDELGFKARVRTLSNENLREDITRYDDVRVNLSNPASPLDDLIRVVYFSDNVGVAMPVNNRHHDGDLATVLGAVAATRWSLRSVAYSCAAASLGDRCMRTTPSSPDRR